VNVEAERLKTRRPSVAAFAAERLADRERRRRDGVTDIASPQITRFWVISVSAIMMWSLRLFSWEFAVRGYLCDWWSSVINEYKPVTYHTRLHATKHLNVRLQNHSPVHSRRRRSDEQ